MPKVALVYDRVNKIGGAERVLEALHRIYPEAPLYTAVYDRQGAPWAHGWDVRPSFLQYLPFARRHHEWFASMMPLVFESFDFSGFDLVISVTSAEAKGIIVPPHTKHLCYLLTPTRYLWSHTHEYRGHGLLSALRLPFLSKLRQWDYCAAWRPDVLIAISQTVAKRTVKYYRRSPLAVCYPPVEVDRYRTHPAKCITGLRGFYLVVSRLVPYKRVLTVVTAFRDLPDQQLVVVGTGSQAPALHRRATANVTFIPSIPDAGLACLYHHARALIFPQEEDFGLVPVEAQAAGLPVIAFGRGGATETVVPQETGILYDNDSVAGLIAAIYQAQSHTWDPLKIQAHAEQFTDIRYNQNFSKIVKEIV